MFPGEKQDFQLCLPHSHFKWTVWLTFDHLNITFCVHLFFYWMLLFILNVLDLQEMSFYFYGYEALQFDFLDNSYNSFEEENLNIFYFEIERKD